MNPFRRVGEWYPSLTPEGWRRRHKIEEIISVSIAFHDTNWKTIQRSRGLDGFENVYVWEIKLKISFKSAIDGRSIIFRSPEDAVREVKPSPSLNIFQTLVLIWNFSLNIAMIIDSDWGKPLGYFPRNSEKWANCCFNASGWGFLLGNLDPAR
jgi:hypothetical protein